MPDRRTSRSTRPTRRLRSLTAPAAVLAGGLAGSAARAAVVAAFPAEPAAFPTVTLAVNLTGSLLLGLYLARRQRSVVPRWTIPFWAIGVLGSFTTFSAFSVEVVRPTGTPHAVAPAIDHHQGRSSRPSREKRPRWHSG